MKRCFLDGKLAAGESAQIPKKSMTSAAERCSARGKESMMNLGMHRKRRGLIAAAWIAMMLCLLPQTVLASPFLESDDGLFFEPCLNEDGLETGELIVAGYTGYSGTVRIPSQVDGKRVVGIKQLAFAQNKKLTKVTIPSSVAILEKEIFIGCENLRSVTLPASITEIPSGMFRDCRMLRSLALPAALEKIGSFAFEGCVRLRKLSIPAGVREIDPTAFQNCEDLILDCSENAYAASYAQENFLCTREEDSPDYPLWQTLRLSGAALLLFGIGWLLFRLIRRKKQTAASADCPGICLVSGDWKEDNPEEEKPEESKAEEGKKENHDGNQ